MNQLFEALAVSDLGGTCGALPPPPLLRPIELVAAQTSVVGFGGPTALEKAKGIEPDGLGASARDADVGRRPARYKATLWMVV